MDDASPDVRGGGIFSQIPELQESPDATCDVAPEDVGQPPLSTLPHRDRMGRGGTLHESR